MLLLRGVPLVALCASLVWAQKVSPTAKASDEEITIEAKAYLDRDSMKSVLGQDPGENILIVEVQLVPAAGKKIDIQRDDFLLRSDRDGQKSQALHPSQIAGSSVLVISSRGGTQGTPMSEQRRVPFGVPGIPGMGGPMSLPGNGPPTGGSATADTSSADASAEEGDKNKPNPLLDALNKKVLPEGEITEPTKGLLYFVIEGKQRPKDLELVYRRAPPRLSVRFPKK
jgi:hypothetical protein